MVAESQRQTCSRQASCNQQGQPKTPAGAYTCTLTSGVGTSYDICVLHPDVRIQYPAPAIYSRLPATVAPGMQAAVIAQGTGSLIQ